MRRELDDGLPSACILERTLVEETFDAEQVKAIVQYLCQELGIVVAVNAAPKPSPGSFGASAIPCDGLLKTLRVFPDGNPDGIEFTGSTGKEEWGRRAWS